MERWKSDAHGVGGLRTGKIPSLFDIRSGNNSKNQEGEFYVGANALSDCNGCAGETEIMKSYIRNSFVALTFPHFSE